MNTPEESKKARTELAARLRAHAPEIEKAIFTRIRSSSESVPDEDPAYLAGLQGAVAEALNYRFESIEKGGESSVPIPPETAQQARRAAREGVRLDTALLRYSAGNKSLEEFIVAEANDVPSQVLCQILSDQGFQLARLMESVSAEYRDELERTRRSSAQRRGDRILHLLKSNSLVRPTDLDYDFDIWHVGMILVGPNAERLARALAKKLGCRALPVVRDREITWTWLGNSQQPVAANLERFLITKTPEGISVAIGEPRKGLDGWRQTHYEAQATLQILLYQPNRLTRCRDVILDAAVLRDQWLTKSLIETYLTPLDGFEADQSVANAALALGKSRNTVERHLRRVEEKLDQTLNMCNAQLRVALRAEELVNPSDGTQFLPRA